MTIPLVVTQLFKRPAGPRGDLIRLLHTRMMQVSVIQSIVVHALKHYEQGNMTRMEVLSRCGDCVTSPAVADIIFDSFPTGRWKDQFSDHVVCLAKSTEPLIRLFGGIYSWEIEQDPVLKAEMKARQEKLEELAHKRYVEVVIPAMQAWVALRDKRGMEGADER